MERVERVRRFKTKPRQRRKRRDALAGIVPEGEIRERAPQPENLAEVLGSEVRAAEALFGGVDRARHIESKRAEQRARDQQVADAVHNGTFVSSYDCSSYPSSSNSRLATMGMAAAPHRVTKPETKPIWMQPDWKPEDGLFKARKKAQRDDAKRADIASRPHRSVVFSGGTLYPSTGATGGKPGRADAPNLPEVKRNGVLGAAVERRAPRVGSRRDFDPVALEAADHYNLAQQGRHPGQQGERLARLAVARRAELETRLQREARRLHQDPDAGDRSEPEPAVSPLRQLRDTRATRMAGSVQGVVGRASRGAPGQAAPDDPLDRLPAQPFSSAYAYTTRKQGHGEPFDNTQRPLTNLKQDTSSAAARRTHVRLRPLEPESKQVNREMRVPDFETNEQRLLARSRYEEQFAFQQREEGENSAAARRAQRHAVMVHESGSPRRPDILIPGALASQLASQLASNSASNACNSKDDFPLSAHSPPHLSAHLSARLSAQTFEQAGGRRARGGYVTV